MDQPHQESYVVDNKSTNNNMSPKDNEEDSPTIEMMKHDHFQQLKSNNISKRSSIPKPISTFRIISDVESTETSPLRSFQFNNDEDEDIAHLHSIQQGQLTSTYLSEHSLAKYSFSEKSLRMRSDSSKTPNRPFLTSQSCKARMNYSSVIITTPLKQEQEQEQKEKDPSLIIDVSPSQMDNAYDQSHLQGETQSSIVTRRIPFADLRERFQTQLRTVLGARTARMAPDKRMQEQSLREREEAALARLQQVDRENQQKLRNEKAKMALCAASERSELQHQFLQQRQAIESYALEKGAIIREKYGCIKKGGQTPIKALEVVIMSAPVLLEVCMDGYDPESHITSPICPLFTYFFDYHVIHRA